MDPYREPYRAPQSPRRARRKLFDPELAGVYLAMEILAVVRVAVGLRSHQPFDAELTVALAAVFLLPLLARS